MLKNCVKKLTYEKCLPRILEIWSQSGFKAYLEIKARRQRDEKEARNESKEEHQVEDDDADDNEQEKEHWG